MSEDFGAQLEQLKFQIKLKDLFAAVTKRGWKVKLVIWDPATGEEWEANPAGERQTKRPSARVRTTVVDP